MEDDIPREEDDDLDPKFPPDIEKNGDMLDEDPESVEELAEEEEDEEDEKDKDRFDDVDPN